MSHAQSHGATNGASLEDCHANFFSLVSIAFVRQINAVTLVALVITPRSFVRSFDPDPCICPF